MAKRRVFNVLTGRQWTERVDPNPRYTIELRKDCLTPEIIGAAIDGLVMTIGFERPIHFHATEYYDPRIPAQCVRFEAEYRD